MEIEVIDFSCQLDGDVVECYFWAGIPSSAIAIQAQVMRGNGVSDCLTANRCFDLIACFLAAIENNGVAYPLIEFILSDLSCRIDSSDLRCVIAAIDPNRDWGNDA